MESREKIIMVITIVIALLLTPIVFDSVWATPVPDTGQTKCYDNTQEITCPQPGEPFYGQDAQYITNPQSYKKLDASGNDLPDDATEWVMVRDNVTGLIWENKTDDGSIHDKDNYYNWYDAQDVFIATINSQNFGGHSDWRLPMVKELPTIVDSSIYCPGPAINIGYFSNTISNYYWSSTTHVSNPSYAWEIFFLDGYVTTYLRSYNYYVRAVRGGQCGSFGNYIDNEDGTITDTDTGLMWQKDTAPSIYTWENALHYCDTLTLAEYNDWRLPNRNELQSLVDYNSDHPSINTTFFPNTVSSYGYWSSTTHTSNLYVAWFVDFRVGSVGMGWNKYYTSLYVRAVRGSGVDSDHDGIFNDGDISGTPGDNPCSGGQTLNCDDNCPTTPNSDQLDSFPPQGNGIGDACDCEANFDCDQDVDAVDVTKFLEDFGRSQYNNPCPMCVAGDWCSYN